MSDFKCIICGATKNAKGKLFTSAIALEQHNVSTHGDIGFHLSKHGKIGIESDIEAKLAIRKRMMLENKVKENKRIRKKMAEGLQAMRIKKENDRIQTFGLPYVLGLSPTFSNVFQITWETVDIFQERMENCVVSIKADGIRCLIHCDLDGNCVALTCSWDIICFKWNWMVRYLGKVHTYCGFLLESEMVQYSNSTLYLVHNVVRLQDRSQIGNLLKPFDRLNDFVTKLKLPCVICKSQISSTADWRNLLLQGSSYSTDSLIFAQTFEDRIETWKWKAPDNISIDFMLWNSIVYNDRLLFDLYVLKTPKRDYSAEVVRQDHVKFLLAGFDSFITLSIDEVPLFTRGIIVELRWSAEAGEWEFICFRNDKKDANTLPVVIQLLNLVATPLPIERVMGVVKSYYDLSPSAFDSTKVTSAPELTSLIRCEDILSHENLNSDAQFICNFYRSGTFRETRSSNPRSHPLSSILFLLVPSLLLVGDILPHLQIREIRVFAATCFEAHHLAERVSLKENREAYIQSIMGRRYRCGSFPTRGIGYMMQVLGFTTRDSFLDQKLFANASDKIKSDYFSHDMGRMDGYGDSDSD
jgi:hypothetical protein